MLARLFVLTKSPKVLRKGFENMKTTTNELRILYDDPVPQSGTCFKRSVSTMYGDLMTSRLRALISTHGDRVLIPNKLVLEILRNRDKLSRRLKVAQRNLTETEEYSDYLDDCLCEVSSALAELFNATAELCDMIGEYADEDTIANISAELEATRDVLDRIEPMFACEDEDDGFCDCDDEE